MEPKIGDVDILTLSTAIAVVKAMPDNAVNSAAQAAASAAEARTAADSVSPATVSEALSYLGIN